VAEIAPSSSCFQLHLCDKTTKKNSSTSRDTKREYNTHLPGTGTAISSQAPDCSTCRDARAINRAWPGPRTYNGHQAWWNSNDALLYAVQSQKLCVVLGFGSCHTTHPSVPFERTSLWSSHGIRSSCCSRLSVARLTCNWSDRRLSLIKRSTKK
jgi:hypothetical protein